MKNRNWNKLCFINNFQLLIITEQPTPAKLLAIVSLRWLFFGRRRKLPLSITFWGGDFTGKLSLELIWAFAVWNAIKGFQNYRLEINDKIKKPLTWDWLFGFEGMSTLSSQVSLPSWDGFSVSTSRPEGACEHRPIKS